MGIIGFERSNGNIGFLGPPADLAGTIGSRGLMWGGAGSGTLSAAHSRVRLRAPDEVESETSAGASALGRGANGAAGGRGVPAFKQEEAPGAQLPHSSPDYIEERLENLKRRPAWSDYLDQYVEAFSDDENDEAEVRGPLCATEGSGH
jgi:hypothetical protein